MKNYALKLKSGVRGARVHQAASSNKWKLRASTVAVISALSLLASGQVLAADELPPSELQAENLRLRKEIEALKKNLNADTAPVSESAASDTGAVAQVPSAGETESKVETLEQFVVRARTREEKLQDIPIPVSAVSGKALERNNAVTIQDFAKLTPGLLVHVPNARQQSISIRGVGKNVSNDALEPSVGVIVDGVASGYIAQAYGDFGDLDHVEVVRGPQGTLLGKNTTLGVVNVVTKAPSFKPEANVEVSTGDHKALGTKASVGGSIQDGVLAYRASFFAEKRNGPFTNIAPDQTTETFQERDRFGGKVSFLLLPSDSVSARFNLDRQESAELIPWGQPPLIGEPATFLNGVSRTLVTSGNGTAINALTYTSRLARPYFGGYQPLIGNWDTVDNRGSRPTRSISNGASAEVNWNFDSDSKLTSITAYRDALFDAKNDGIWTHFDISRNGAIITQKQVSEELRLNSTIGKSIDYTAGLYLLGSKVDSTDRNLYGTDAGAFYATTAQYNTLSTTAAGKQLLQDSLRDQFAYTKTQPNTKSAGVFGQLNWHLDEKSTLTLGLRQTRENKSNDFSKWYDNSLLAKNGDAYYTALGATVAQLNAAKAISNNQLGSKGPAFQSYSIPGAEINATSYSWLINPSYKLTEDVLLYASVGKGEKSGSTQLDASGSNGATKPVPFTVKPERVLDFELGTKATLLNNALVVNTNIYQTKITDYQQTLSEVDQVATANTGITTFRNFLGNVPGVTLRGIEVDGSYALNERALLNFGAAYNHAFYSDFMSSPCPTDISSQLDPVTGKTIAANQICNFTGKTLPYAPKLTGNIGADWRLPLAGNYNLHVFGNAVYRGKANYAADLSASGERDAYTLVDGGIGIQSKDAKLELALVGKNLADTKYVTSINSYSASVAASATPGERRYLGVVLRGKL